jgi:hypothetical protein
MGAIALGVLWVNALLVAAAAVKQVGALLARRRGLGDLVRGRVIAGDGPGGAFATHRVEQVGRAGVDAESILFHDRSAGGEIYGGALEVLGVERRVRAVEGAEVWLTREAIGRAGACPSRKDFDAAYATASKAKGFARTLDATIGAGAEVFFAERPEGGPALVAIEDPRPLLLRRAILGAAFIVAELAAAAACTVIALQPPVFGAVSTVGGALGLVFFLTVQPAGTAARDAMLVPSRVPARGRWRRSST